MAVGTEASKSSLEGAAASHLRLVTVVQEGELRVARSSVFPRKWRPGLDMKSPNLRTGLSDRYRKG